MVFGLYWFVFASRLKARNLFLLAASYLFYGWWDWRFLGLIVASTFVDYMAGLAMGRSTGATARRAWLGLSLVANLSLLGFFKYWNFFVDSWLAAWGSLGIELHAATVQIILPVGISFYTFQTLSYTIDVYRRRIEPTTDLPAFAAFVAFFPQLVAGPIERAASLLGQFRETHRFSYSDAAEGSRQILWGLFKKVVIADQLAPHVDFIFANYESQPSLMLLIGAVLFAFQIYCDFSGYSDIAIGTARLFGFRLMTNFRYPYFARDIGEFWRRWHISLSTWFRDYVYIPLGGSRGGRARTLRNVLIVFMVSGLWHGANWTFVAWGALHAALFLPSILMDRHRLYLDDAAPGRLLPSLRELTAIKLTFLQVCLAWIFFRAESWQHATGYLGGMVAAPFVAGSDPGMAFPLLLVAALVLTEWVCRHKPFPLSCPAWPAPLRLGVYFVLLYWTLLASKSATEFIYFQF